MVLLTHVKTSTMLQIFTFHPRSARLEWRLHSGSFFKATNIFTLWGYGIYICLQSIKRKAGCSGKCGTQFLLVNKKGFYYFLTLVNIRGLFFYALRCVNFWFEWFDFFDRVEKLRIRTWHGKQYAVCYAKYFEL